MERLLADATKLTGVTYDIDNLSDVYEAIHVIQGELGITGTTAKEGASTFSGSMAAMKAAASNVMAYMANGMDITPAVTNLVQATSTFIFGNALPMVWRVISALPDALCAGLQAAVAEIRRLFSGALKDIGSFDFASMMSGFNTALSNVLLNIGDVIKEALGAAPELAETGGKILEAVVQGIGNSLGLITDACASILNAFVDSVFETLPVLFDAAIGIVNALVDGIIEYAPYIIECAGNVLVNFLEGLIQNLPSIIEGAYQLVNSIVQGIGEALPYIIDAAAEVCATLWQVLEETDWMTLGSNVLNAVVDGLLSLIATAWDAAKKVANKIIDGIKSIDFKKTGKDVIDKVISGITGVFTLLWDKGKEVAQKVVDGIKSFNFLDVGKDIVDGVISGIGSMGSSLLTAAKGIGESILNGAKSFLGIASPSKLMRDEIGKFIPAGIAVGVEANMSPLDQTMEKMARRTLRVGKLAVPDTSTLPGRVGWSSDSIIDYDRIEEAMAAAIDKMPARDIYLNGRKVGREIDMNLARLKT